ncbi:hypothetical protein [Flavobacterium sp.]|uniref:hypothetical protein n=1 Tax=Flavobacterium sp. TaxID=239 RepID=UPI002600C5BB|nr:hypothetical protein [Flavobacterium sp.]
MKKLLVFLLLSGAVYSQNILKKETINQYLCKTWMADYAMMGGLKVEKMGQMKSLTYSFKADHTYLANGTVSGKWQYNSKNKNIELFAGDVLKSTITTLKSKKMVMVLNADKSGPKEMSALEIYFKQKM